MFYMYFLLQSQRIRELLEQEEELESRCEELEKYIQELQVEHEELLKDVKPSAIKVINPLF